MAKKKERITNPKRKRNFWLYKQVIKLKLIYELQQIQCKLPSSGRFCTLLSFVIIIIIIIALVISYFLSFVKVLKPTQQAHPIKADHRGKMTLTVDADVYYLRDRVHLSFRTSGLR